MPMTFAFNRKELECILNIPDNEVGWNDDMLWRKNTQKSNRLAHQSQEHK